MITLFDQIEGERERDSERKMVSCDHMSSITLTLRDNALQIEWEFKNRAINVCI